MVDTGRSTCDDPGQSSSLAAAVRPAPGTEDLAEQRRALEAEKAQLLEERAVRKRENEIPLLKQPAEGSEASPGVDAESSPSGLTSQVGSKRTRNDIEVLLELPESRRRRIEPGSGLHIEGPKKYNSQNRRQYREFIRHCEVMHRLQPAEFPTDRTKLLYASLSLEGYTLDAWLRYEKDAAESVTWEEFKQMLGDLLPDLSIAHTVRYFDAKQKPGQSVKQFVDYLYEIEAELSPYSDNHRRIMLFAKLRPELRRAIRTYQDQPTTLSELIKLASRLEALNEPGHEATASTDRTHTDQAQSQGQRSGSLSSKRRGQKPKGKKKRIS